MGKVIPENSQNAETQTRSGKEDISSLSQKLKQALESRESKESLRKIGDSLYEAFKDPEYSADIVLSSVKESFEENKNSFRPPLSLNGFIQSFGSGMVRLIQQKLVEFGGFDLGKYGPRGNGIDGKLGRMTGNAIKQYFEKAGSADGPRAAAETPAAAPQPNPAAAPGVISAAVSTAPTFSPEVSAYAPPQKDLPAPSANTDQNVDLSPYKPGTERPSFTPVGPLQSRIRKIYDGASSTYTTDSMPAQLGRTRERIEPFLTNIDPVTGGPLTFLGAPFLKPPSGGMNLMAIPFLKIAEEKIRAAHIAYKPAIKIYKGYEFRGLKIKGKPSDKIMSSHSFGMAFDIDPSENMPEDGRGNIPDEVVMALVESGFAWGSVPYEGFHFAADPMHFQLRFDPRDAIGSALINSSKAGSLYWQKVQPLLDAVKPGERA